MGWAAHHIERLKAGRAVQFRPHGHSMTGKINDGQLVTVEPLVCRFLGCKSPALYWMELPDGAGWVFSGAACSAHTGDGKTHERRSDLVSVGDAVLCKVNGREYLHLVKAKKGARYLIGNNKGFDNGWTVQIFGKVTKVEP